MVSSAGSLRCASYPAHCRSGDTASARVRLSAPLWPSCVVTATCVHVPSAVAALICALADVRSAEAPRTHTSSAQPRQTLAVRDDCSPEYPDCLHPLQVVNLFTRNQGQYTVHTTPSVYSGGDSLQASPQGSPGGQVRHSVSNSTSPALSMLF
jgi:hypothetical protein